VVDAAAASLRPRQRLSVAAAPERPARTADLPRPPQSAIPQHADAIEPHLHRGSIAAGVSAAHSSTGVGAKLDEE
jgi:hypothetical protein